MKSFKEYLLTEKIVEKLQNLFKAKIGNLDSFVPTIENAKTIFDILNKIVFNSKLENIPIVVEHFDPKKHKSENSNNYSIGVSKLFFDPDKVNNFHKTDMSDKHFRDMYRNDEIVVTYYSNTTFEKFVSIMAHEMIHQLEIVDSHSKYRIYLHMLSKFNNDGFVYNAHSKFFTDEMNRINKNFGLDVMPTEEMTTEEFDKMLYELDLPNGILKEDDSISSLSDTEKEEIRNLAKRMRKLIKNDGTSFVRASKEGVYLYIL